MNKRSAIIISSVLGLGICYGIMEPDLAISQTHRRLPCPDGECSPDRVTFGYFETRWRKWPVEPTPDEARLPVRREELEDVVLPPPEEEDFPQTREPATRARPAPSGAAAPEFDSDEGVMVPPLAPGVPDVTRPGDEEQGRGRVPPLSPDLDERTEEQPGLIPRRPETEDDDSPLFQPPGGFPIERPTQPGGNSLDELFRGSGSFQQPPRPLGETPDARQVNWESPNIPTQQADGHELWEDADEAPTPDRLEDVPAATENAMQHLPLEQADADRSNLDFSMPQPSWKQAARPPSETGQLAAHGNPLRNETKSGSRPHRDRDTKAGGNWNYAARNVETPGLSSGRRNPLR